MGVGEGAAEEDEDEVVVAEADDDGAAVDSAEEEADGMALEDDDKDEDEEDEAAAEVDSEAADDETSDGAAALEVLAAADDDDSEEDGVTEDSEVVADSDTETEAEAEAEEVVDSLVTGSEVAVTDIEELVIDGIVVSLLLQKPKMTWSWTQRHSRWCWRLGSWWQRPKSCCWQLGSSSTTRQPKWWWWCWLSAYQRLTSCTIHRTFGWRYQHSLCCTGCRARYRSRRGYRRSTRCRFADRRSRSPGRHRRSCTETGWPSWSSC